MATTAMDEDALLTSLLTALEDLHNLRSEMHNCIKQGFFNMAKARRSLGRNSVSVLDTREEYSAEVKINIAFEAEETEPRTALDARAIFTRDRATDATAIFSGVGDGSLRQRGGAGTQQLDSEDSPMQSDSDGPTRGDSLSLFAGLVPPPLRKSKKNFSSAVDYAVEAANLVHHINCLWKQLEAVAKNGNTATDSASGHQGDGYHAEADPAQDVSD